MADFQQKSIIPGTHLERTKHVLANTRKSLKFKIIRDPVSVLVLYFEQACEIFNDGLGQLFFQKNIGQIMLSGAHGKILPCGIVLSFAIQCHMFDKIW